jgi:hypothetical protein
MQKHQFKATIALTTSLLLAALTGCSQGVNNDASAGSSSSSSAEAGSGPSYNPNTATEHTSFFVKDNGDGTKVIKDVDGTEVTVPVKAERIANMWHANNQVTLLLGGAPKLAATTSYVSTIPWFKKVYPNIEKVPTPVNQQNGLNMEELLATKPDVVLVADEKQAEQVRGAGLTAVRVGFKDLDGLQKTVELTAEVIGTQGAYERAQKYNAYMKRNISLVKERLGNLPQSDKPKVLHIGAGDEVTKVTGSGVVIDEWIKLAGGTNAVSDVKGMKGVSMEQITAAAPDVIIVGGDTSARGVQTIKDDAAWADIPAVKNGKVYRNPLGTFNWDRYSTEEALQVLWSAKTLHPDKFTDVDLVKETREFYATYYGYNLTEDEAKLIIAGDAPR